MIIKVARLLPDKPYLSLKFYKEFGRFPNWKNPQTFNEKLQWLKLYYRKPEFTLMVDKYEVKEYVKKEIGDEYVIPTLGVWDKPEDIEWDVLPNQFVLKTTHGGGNEGIVICRDKSSFNKDNSIRKLNKNLCTDLYTIWREWPYKNVQKRIIAEKYMQDESGYELKDYKFFCFGGIPHFIQLDFDRFTEHKKNLYSLDWELLPFEFNYPRHPECLFQRPKGLNKMIEVAKKLSKGIPFVRVDLYNINGDIFVGELTFFPAGGMGKFQPKEWDKKFGDMLILPKDVRK